MKYKQFAVTTCLMSCLTTSLITFCLEAYQDAKTQEWWLLR